MHPFLLATLKANEIIHDTINNKHSAEWYQKHSVGAGGDISSGFDLFAEKVFYDHLHHFGSIESEESGVMNDGKAKIIIDPIDGSDNALSKFGYFGTSVAYINSSGILEHAMICNLATSEVFWVTKSNIPQHGKLFQNIWMPIELNNHSKIGIFERAYAYPSVVQALHDNDIKFRSPGALALSLAYARWVDFVLFVGPFRIYDVAAGLALCEGLEVIIQEDYAIVSKEKGIALKIEQIINSILEENL
ncbi:MAG: inositol monophosphatase [Sulfurovaceae bacterium]|nr:inositol monophosphatase [Sulfurovaceae bacterium]